MTFEAGVAISKPMNELLTTNYAITRNATLELCQHLEPEDFVIQSMPDVSPTKWHLAHTSWFFEEFILKVHDSAYCPFNEYYHHLFNSYYYSAGQMHPRPLRGLLSRPLVGEIMAYREHVDEAMEGLLSKLHDDPVVKQKVMLGIQHEQQHQELLLTDIKHVFWVNPMKPVMNPMLPIPGIHVCPEQRFISRTGGIFEIGAGANGFSFDNETPRHRVLLQEHGMGSRLVNNREYREFIRDGGYENSGLWLSDGWSTVMQEGWSRPLYWSEDLASEFTLGGQRDLDLEAPASHVSYYEADAFARWAGARLPTEAEWETFADEQEPEGNLRESGFWHPQACDGSTSQVFGDVWEWTSSGYSAYPGFKPLEGSLGEYNGKFMCNQVTVRGGSCVTSRDHIRASYRSFFYPDARWQFLGFRLAKDGVAA